MFNIDEMVDELYTELLMKEEEINDTIISERFDKLYEDELPEESYEFIKEQVLLALDVSELLEQMNEPKTKEEHDWDLGLSQSDFL